VTRRAARSTLHGVVLALLCLADVASAQRPSLPITPPVAIEGSQAQPSYPESARRLGIQGTATLRVQVLANGQVGEVAIEQSAGHPDLDQAAIDAARRWRFEPARRGKDPVPVWMRLAMTFALKGGEEPNPTLAVAGRVTTLDGVGSVQRVGRPDGVPLKVNDDVLVQDRIMTADAAKLEMVLGGKLDVEMRGRSAVTITEISGRSTLDLDAGQIALRVRGEALRAGDVIDVRTLNAVATMRGEARVRIETIAPAERGGAAVTHVDVLDGTVAVATNVDFKNPLLYRGLPPAGVELRANQGVTITGEVPGAIRALRSSSTP